MTLDEFYEKLKIIMNNEEIKRMEWNLLHNKEFVKKNRNILKCLDVILPAGDDYYLSTKKGEIFLTQEDISIIKTAIRCSMEETSAWIEYITKELEELKNGIHKQS